MVVTHKSFGKEIVKFIRRVVQTNDCLERCFVFLLISSSFLLLLLFLLLVSSFTSHLLHDHTIPFTLSKHASSLFCHLRFRLHHSSSSQSSCECYKYIYTSMRLLLNVSLSLGTFPFHRISFHFDLDIWRFHSVLFAFALLITFMCSICLFLASKNKIKTS